MSNIRRLLRRGLNVNGQSEAFEDWLSAVVTQLLSCRHLLYTRSGLLFGFRIGWHVYTVQGYYVGSFRDALEDRRASELFSASGRYLGELDPDDDERLGVDLSKRHLRRPAVPELPALPTAAVALYSVRDPLLPREHWSDFPSPDAFAHRGKSL